MDSIRAAGRRAIWQWTVPPVLAVALLYLSLRGVEWRRVWMIITGAHWHYLVAGSAIAIGSLFLRSLRWRVLLNAESRLAVATVFWATAAGYLGNNLLPARAGELVRTFLISRQSCLSKTFVLTTALSERLMDAIALLLWSSVVLLGVEPKPPWLGQVSRAAAVIAGVGLVVLVALPRTGNLLQSAITRIPMPGSLRCRLLKLAEQVLLGMRSFHDGKRFAAFAALTMLIWIADAISIMTGARALDLHLSFGVAALLLCGLGLGSAMPSTPGYVGIYQFVAVSVLTPFGVSRDSAVAYILLAQALNYVVVLTFGMPGLSRFRQWRTELNGPESQRTA